MIAEWYNSMTALIEMNHDKTYKEYESRNLHETNFQLNAESS